MLPKLDMVKPSGVDKEIYTSSEDGVLTREGKKLLEDYSGYKFDFPPGPGQPAPSERIYIAQARSAEYQVCSVKRSFNGPSRPR